MEDKNSVEKLNAILRIRRLYYWRMDTLCKRKISIISVVVDNASGCNSALSTRMLPNVNIKTVYSKISTKE